MVMARSDSDVAIHLYYNFWMATLRSADDLIGFARFCPRSLNEVEKGDRSGKKLKKSVELGERVEVLEPGGGKDRFSSLDKSFTPV